MSFALLFSGQGMQHSAMLPWLADDLLVEAVNVRLGVTDWRMRLNDTTWASNNVNAQCLLTGLSLAAWAQLARRLPPPAAIAGYSVGELAAFSAAGVFDATIALNLARDRAHEMDRSALHEPGGMLAVRGLSPSVLAALLRVSGAVIAIRNGVESVVLGGPCSALERAELAATEHGAHCTRLRVNIASHTPWMRKAANAFAKTLDHVDFNPPASALFTNALDRVFDASSAKRALAQQIAQVVRWDECMENVRARGVACVLEVGPGQALARMWNQRYSDVPARACDDFRTGDAVVRWVCSYAEA